MTTTSIVLAFRWLFVAGSLALAVGCATPSNYRNWTPDLATMPYVDLDGTRVTVHNVRNCTYLTDEEYVVNHYTKSFDLNDLQSADFLGVPFEGLPMIAHTMLSFGLRDGSHLALSVEIRRERNEEYRTLNGMFNQYELMYVFGDERDLIKLRTEYRKSDVYLYHATATPEQVRNLFVDVARRANKLAKEPEFYNTLTNNCTTNIAQHINHLAPNTIPYSIRVLLPGYSDRLAYDLGLIEKHGTFEETRRRAYINGQAALHRDDPDFSKMIRR